MLRYLKNTPWARGLVACVVLGITLTTLGVSMAFVVPLPARLSIPDSQVIEYRDGSTAHVFLAPDDRWRLPTDLDDVDPGYLKALVRLEDKRFREHHGVDPIAIARSAFLNLRRKRIVSGASTITMQLVRLLEPRPRTYRSKAVEVLRALQLELRLSKTEILQAYLRFLPFGRNLEGIETAALAFFGHPAKTLSAAEIATLLAVPQAPTSRHPGGSRTESLRRSRDSIALRLLNEGALPRGPDSEKLSNMDIVRSIQANPPPPELLPMPREAPHVAWWLKGRRSEQRVIRTELERGLQRYLERVMHATGQTYAPLGIRHGAAVIVSHQDGAVRAAVGSFDFSNVDAGQIPGFAVRRSTGSTLKPFIYARAIDAGLSLPSMLVEDVPLRFGDYEPSNYSGRHQGLVRLDEALAASLNIPFIALLNELGIPAFFQTMQRLGVDVEYKPAQHGLSSAIGGLELTPLELASAYASLAQGGRRVSARLVPAPDEPSGAKHQQGLSAESAWLTRKALSNRDRPDFPARRSISGTPAGVHWKTGTSSGHRDAWAVGSDARYTVVVWLGNFDQASSAALVGANVAGPLLFDILEAVAEPSIRPPDDMPSNLIEIDVCTLSGYPSNSNCKTTKAMAVSRSIPQREDPFHIEAEVDPRSGLRVSPACRPATQRVRRTFIKWPFSVRSFLSAQEQGDGLLPPFAPGCLPSGPRKKPMIVSPPPEQTLLLVRGMPLEQQQVPLRARPAHGSTEINWFVNGRLLTSLPSDASAWWTPTRGVHEIVAMDSAGHTASQTITVR